jgi:hypothetical protein
MPGSACRRHRTALIDFVDRRERGPRTPAALDHLARCQRCEDDMADYALTIVALRRAGRELAAVPVPVADVTRVVPSEPRPSGWSWRLQVGGLVTCAAIVAMLIVPGATIRTSPDGGLLSDSGPGRTDAASLSSMEPARRAEARLAAFPDIDSYAAAAGAPANSIIRRPSRKEVPQTDARPRAVRSW